MILYQLILIKNLIKMKKIRIIEGTTDGGAGSKGQFVINSNSRKIKIVGSTTDGGAGSKGLFAVNEAQKNK